MKNNYQTPAAAGDWEYEMETETTVISDCKEVELNPKGDSNSHFALFPSRPKPACTSDITNFATTLVKFKRGTLPLPPTNHTDNFSASGV